MRSVLITELGVQPWESTRPATMRRIFDDNGDHDNIIIIMMAEVTIIMAVIVMVVIKET
jgi:hypothetical protein